MTNKRAITYDDVATMPAPGSSIPVDIRISADSRMVTWLFSSEGTMSRELWALDRETGRQWRLLDTPADAEHLTREERLRRERQRQYGSGVTGHAWSAKGDTLLILRGGEALVQHGVDGKARVVGEGPGVLDPRLSPDGLKVAYVQGGELYVQDVDSDDPPRQLTFDAATADEYGDQVVTNGLAEFVAQEEMGRAAGFWWSPDGAYLAFEQADSSPIPYYYIVHPGTDEVEIEAHRYPFAGKANARVKLGVVAVTGGAPSWLTWTDNEDAYLARVYWTPDGRVLALAESRDQRRVEVRQIDPATEAVRVLWVEACDPWVNLHDDLRFVQPSDVPTTEYDILWSSEREGKRNLYLYSRDGELLRHVSDGRGFIDEVRGVDAERGSVYVEGWDTTPVERHLFRIPLKGGPAERVTPGEGAGRAVLAPDFSAYVHVSSAIDMPPTVELRAIDGSTLTRLQEGAPPDERLELLDLPRPELITVTAADGETLHAAVYHPRGLVAGAKAPIIVDVYGGPHAQQVVDSWGMTVDLRNQVLADSGFYVITLDNRGSARRGLLFEGQIAGNLGDLEVRDQADGVRALAARYPDADIERVGVVGWSYGGYMALMCLARAPQLFKAAVAGAPVTNWDGYDTHYTERYMGSPATNTSGYRDSSVMTHAKAITGKLLIIHGMIDENVHFRHTGRLMQKLIEYGIPFETTFFPEERHGPRRKEDRVFLERRVVEFFKAALQ